jgi:plasmid rolling circle replication initiator protein Rep
MKGTQEIQDCEVQRKGTGGGDELDSYLLDIIQTSVGNCEKQGDDSALDSYADRKRLGLKIAKQLEKLGFHERARKIRQCSQMFYERSYSCGHKSIARRGQGKLCYRCGDKLCPICIHVRSVKLAKGLGSALESLSKSKGLYVHHLTLTLANTWTLPDYAALRKMAKRLLDSESKARRAVWERYGYYGALMSFEVPPSKRIKGMWNPHFHILLFTERPIELIETGEHAGNWQNSVNQELSDLWQKITKDSYIVQGKSFDVSRIFEVVKYFTKVADMNDEQLAEIVKWSHGKRFLSRLGALHGNDELAELMDAQDTGEPECCPECGCNEYVDVPVVFDPRLCRYVREQDWYDRPLILPLSPS